MRRSRAKTIALYTVVFAVLFCLCFWCWNREYNKSIMSLYDGLTQYYLEFVYIGRWIRECAETLFVSHSLDIPMFDISIGFGDDIITMGSTHIADPFMWIFSLAPETYSEASYTWMIIAKLYCGGLSFLYLCNRRGYSRRASIIGAIVYVFSANSYILNMFAYFLNMLYIFPLVIAGADDLWRKKRSRLFLFSMAWLFFNAFYFAYMSTILLVFYCLLRMIEERDEFASVRLIFVQVGKYIVHVVLGAMLAMPLLLPVLNLMLSSQRIGADYERTILYSLDYYKNWFLGFISSYIMASRDCYIGYSVLAVAGIVILFAHRRQNTRLKVEFVLMTLGMLLPVWGSIMNGMSYSANRWNYAYTLVIAINVVLGVQALPRIAWHRVGDVALLAVAMVSVVVPAWLHFSEDHENALATNVHRDYAYDTITNAGAMPLLQDVGQAENSRFDSYNAGTINNESMMYGVSGMELYSSYGNTVINAFHREMTMLTNATNVYYGLNRRSELEHLMGAERFLITTGEESVGLPYGYSKLELTEDSHGQDYSSYHTTYATSLVHSFDTLVGTSDWEALNPVDRQQALIQAVVVEDGLANASIGDLDLDNDVVPYTVEYDSVTRDGDVYTAEGGRLILHPTENSLMTNGEIYVYLKGIDYSNGDATNYDVFVRGLHDGEETGYYDRLRGTNNKNHIYEGRHDWLICIGDVGADGIDAVSLEFGGDGTYTIEEIGLYFRSNEELAANLNRLNVFEGEVSLDTNEISFTTNADAEQYYLISIPYSMGWKATIDGASAEIIKADTAFMLIQVPAGTHEIVLRYCTPGLVPGILCAILSLAVIMVWYLYVRRTEHGSEAVAVA